jgi:hypothetical protein
MRAWHKSLKRPGSGTVANTNFVTGSVPKRLGSKKLFFFRVERTANMYRDMYDVFRHTFESFNLRDCGALCFYKKGSQIFLKYKEIQKEVIYDKQPPHTWLNTCSFLHLLISSYIYFLIYHFETDPT